MNNEILNELRTIDEQIDELTTRVIELENEINNGVTITSDNDVLLDKLSIVYNFYKSRYIEIIEKTKKMIEDVTREVEEGKVYSVKVVKIEEFGCFVSPWPGCEGMVHIGQLSLERVEKVEDVVKEGDEIIVKCMGYDNRGRLNLSRKEAIK